jgi:tRNA(Ile)-lysidine synthase
MTEENVIVAVSGGADSTALLLALSDLKKRKKLDHSFVIAHFNHKLRGMESDADEEFVWALSKEAGFEFVVGTRKLTGTANLEQRARNERYKFLGKTAKQRNASLILTAHTMNDQAETVLMNLIRGAGVDGLGGMRKIRSIEAGSTAQLVRPVLGWAKREDTEGFCQDLGVLSRKDTMNDDPKFTRVRIRKSVIPCWKRSIRRSSSPLPARLSSLNQKPEAKTASRAGLSGWQTCRIFQETIFIRIFGPGCGKTAEIRGDCN